MLENCTRRLGIGALIAAILIMLGGCSRPLPPPQVVADAPRFARVAELLAMPPLRPVPAEMVELEPPYPCGDNLFLSMQFAGEAGLLLIAGAERYAVMDIGTGEVVASGSGLPGGQISRNGRVLAIPVEGAMELRVAESGEVIVELEEARGDEFSWVGESGIMYVAPGRPGSGQSRVVYLDVGTGLESSLVAVPKRTDDYIFTFGLMPAPDRENTYFMEARRNVYEMTLAAGPEGITASVGKPQAIDFPSYRTRILVDGRIVTFVDDAIEFYDMPGLDRSRIQLPGFFPNYAHRTGDSDRILIGGYFRGEDDRNLTVDGKPTLREYYYSLSRNRLAPIQREANAQRLTYVHPLRSHAIQHEGTFRPYRLPAGGEEGEIAAVLAEARASVVESKGPAE